MRIIAGKYKSRVIQTVSSHTVRPTTGRVRQTIFDLLAHRFDFEAAHVLDLFAGSGILGFEALSRGAEHATFVEQDAKTLKTLTASAAALSVEHQTNLLRTDAFRFLQKTTDSFDLIFCDPPYRLEKLEQLAKLVFEKRLLKEHGFFILEHHSSLSFAQEPYFDFEKTFGTTHVSFFCWGKTEQ
ncbi:methyltransferase [Chloroherpeton thalassium ATCC 35110]|uniref:Methyltransferase n=1 Tax=Chloroherpeton thalassium (strain ATCC 35110 / GB-78) TaxID=517418 RepID=B3QYX1_CHLT3|nr:16S rRNA (guanine(966)-N(2))-methyltransferase RsmD [Chloroherpeton thalassium]ACF13664.1 methyltransferase [Chloroherpeton thalassium ATCC 35110]